MEEDNYRAQNEPSGGYAGTDFTSGVRRGRTPRMTHQNIKAMKSVQQKEMRADVAITKKILGLFSEIAGIFAFAVPGKKTSPCDINGHVLPRVWDGEFPRCSHCNKEIRSADELGGPK
ncbi:MAG TPA: hypothetical protein PKN86_08915 [Candidatus Obscuribacter sp.]|nr:hypothetical protein [Candidatus Obscuribacter sp.]HMX46828.1 hypothetical protein [Candidatus Obscuribacter sp.]HNB15209.1 hypothetical protein [Candidatus Obscuribacter sp.]HND66514.1 hypothetical protein [Candidatus Obscuribacter sp.]HNG19748.1 hypothetical protein [Candidatus Obscuribacter sp.]